MHVCWFEAEEIGELAVWKRADRAVVYYRMNTEVVQTIKSSADPMGFAPPLGTQGNKV